MRREERDLHNDSTLGGFTAFPWFVFEVDAQFELRKDVRSKLRLIDQRSFDTFPGHDLPPRSLGLTHRRLLRWRCLAFLDPKGLKSVFLGRAFRT